MSRSKSTTRIAISSDNNSLSVAAGRKVPTSIANGNSADRNSHCIVIRHTANIKPQE